MNQKINQIQQNILKIFITQEKKLSNYINVILKLYLKLCIKQNREQDIILTPKQVLQRLAIALAQVKAGNNSEYLLNKMRQIVYSLYHSK